MFHWQIPMLKEFEEEKIEEMMKDMKPMVFAEQRYIIREGEPIEQMLLFKKGMGLTFSESNGTRTTINTFGKGDLFGEQLLNWAMENLSVSLKFLCPNVLSRHKPKWKPSLSRLLIHNIIQVGDK
ncbi:hypothetical protein Csa_017461 [Cucumis sativus]|nr:hypothetical protein Csa_017461 [Cucumis sativus]